MPFCQFYPLGIALEVYLIEAITQDGDPNCYEDRSHRNSEQDIRGLIDYRIMHHALVHHIKLAHADPEDCSISKPRTLLALLVPQAPEAYKHRGGGSQHDGNESR
jgi:hypothetical protein